MAALGLGGNFGKDQSASPRRKILGAESGLASRLHYQLGLDSTAVEQMTTEEWESVADGPDKDRTLTVDLLRAYEHYRPV